MRIRLAIHAFFKALFDEQAATAIQKSLRGDERDKSSEIDVPAKPDIPQTEAVQRPHRSDAVTLLATLQREARFVDIVKEPLGDYSDEQIGAASRDVLRDCGAVLDRLFGLTAIVDDEEDTEIEVPSGFDAARYRLTGNVAGDPPFRGRMVHHGWCATRCELPQWSGSEESALTVAPVELEIV